MWTCDMFVPSGMTGNAVFFQRNGTDCGLLLHNENGCLKFDLNPRYTFACVSEYSYALTIPAENMTEYEEGSVWGCSYPGDGSYKSPDVVLNIASKMNLIYLQYTSYPKQINKKCSRFPLQEVYFVQYLRIYFVHKLFCPNLTLNFPECCPEYFILVSVFVLRSKVFIFSLSIGSSPLARSGFPIFFCVFLLVHFIYRYI